MSNRERWIIYPLLFMSLGYGWKANVLPFDELKCRKLECTEDAQFFTASAQRLAGNNAEFLAASTQQLVVRDEGRMQLELLSTNRGGMIHMHRYEHGRSPVSLQAVDELGHGQLIGGLFRHPPQPAPRPETKKDEKPREQKQSDASPATAAK
jgi:hypothetical protein